MNSVQSVGSEGAKRERQRTKQRDEIDIIEVSNIILDLGKRIR